MVKINIIAVGKVKEKGFREGIEEYSKRISRFANLKIIETAEFPPNDNNNSEIEKAKKKEAQNILKNASGYKIAMTMEGENLCSEKFAKMIEDKLQTAPEITFIIGGANGLSKSVKESADMLLSFSKLTFPHTLFRLMLTEQIYRAFSIQNNLPYHR